jgi:hypothetical protein
MTLLWGDLISLDYVSLSSNLTDEEEYPISYRLISCYRWWIKYYKSLQLTDYCYSTERIDTAISWYSAKTQTRKNAYYIFISSFLFLTFIQKISSLCFFSHPLLSPSSNENLIILCFHNFNWSFNWEYIHDLIILLLANIRLNYQFLNFYLHIFFPLHSLNSYRKALYKF